MSSFLYICFFELQKKKTLQKNPTHDTILDAICGFTLQISKVSVKKSLIFVVELFALRFQIAVALGC